MMKTVRSYIRSSSSRGDDDVQILVSLQSCELNENLAVLDEHRKRIKSPGILNHLHGAYAILETLLSKSPSEHDADDLRIQSYLEFHYAVKMFFAYRSNETSNTIQQRTRQKTMKDFLWHPKYGICVYIINHKYILLKGNDIHPEKFLLNILRPPETDSEEGHEINRIDINHDNVQTLLDSMDSEWDKNVLRCILSSSRNKVEVEKLGISPKDLTTKCSQLIVNAAARKAAVSEAEVVVLSNLEIKVKKLDELIESKRKLYNRKQLDWSKVQLDELEEEIGDIQGRKEGILKLLSSYKTEKYYMRKFNNMVVRKVIEEDRIGMRKKTSGRHRMMDEVDERELLKCIEEKTTAHGRRGDEVMYAGHRVKKKDFVKLINYLHRKRNMPLIRSATTVLNRAKPHNKRSLQARKHIGLSLFCTKKAPKSGDTDNDLTHYQRAHKKLIISQFYGDADISPYVFEISMDDKAYLCPGTSTGMTGVRNVKMYQATDVDSARKLPRYDFPVSMVCVTPATYRVMTKEIRDIEGTVRAVIVDDACYVFFRSKYFIGSSASVWSSEFMELRYNHAHKFEIDVNNSVSTNFKKFCIMLRDAFFYFIDSSEKDDVMKISVASDDHKAFYECRLSTLLKTLWYALDTYALDTLSGSDQINGTKIKTTLEVVYAKILSIKGVLEKGSGESVWAEETQLIPILISAAEHIDSIFPHMKTIYLEWTDAGPGVGITNKAVKYRAAQRFRILNMDYLIRHHLANNDSSHNEVERIQSYVGDAICDGAALDWEYKKLFVDFTAEQLNCMSLEQFQALEMKRMAYNAKKVCEEVASRIDGAPAPGGYLTGYVSKKVEDQFFSDHDHLAMYLEKGHGVAGSAYYTKILNFIDKHSRISLKYMEFKKCAIGHGLVCNFCQQNPQKAPHFPSPPAPYPDKSRLPNLHYMSLEETYQHSPEDAPRRIDDFNPRINVTSLYESGKIRLGDVNAIKEFSNDYVVEEKHVKSRLVHLEVLALKKKKKQQQKKSDEAAMTYESIDWIGLYRKGTLKTLKVATLNKYIYAKKLSKHMHLKKSEKIIIIQHSISKELMSEAMRNNVQNKQPGDSDQELTMSDGEEEMEEIVADGGVEVGETPDVNDEVLDVVGDVDESSDEEEEDLDNDEDISDLSDVFTATRSGRVALSWKASKYR